MSQIALPLAWPAAPDADFLVSPANARVVSHLEHWALWPVMATLIVGPRKSGRSLLGRLFAARTGGEFVDDGPRHDEEALFHAWNRAQERRRPLLIVADAPPPAWHIALPDLRSRIGATPCVAIDEPDDDLVARLIERGCAERAMPVPREVVRYVVPRIERSYLAVHRAIDALDALALERRQPATVPLARQALIRLGVIDGSRDRD